MNVIIWDIETIPNLQGFAAANYLTGKTDAEIREVMGDKFPKHIYHSIVCIGALVAHRENDHLAIEAIGAPHVGERSSGPDPPGVDAHCALNATEIALSATRRPVILVWAIGMSIATRSTDACVYRKPYPALFS